MVANAIVVANWSLIIAPLRRPAARNGRSSKWGADRDSATRFSVLDCYQLPPRRPFPRCGPVLGSRIENELELDDAANGPGRLPAGAELHNAGERMAASRGALGFHQRGLLPENRPD